MPMTPYTPPNPTEQPSPRHADEHEKSVIIAIYFAGMAGLALAGWLGLL